MYIAVINSFCGPKSYPAGIGPDDMVERYSHASFNKSNLDNLCSYACNTI